MEDRLRRWCERLLEDGGEEDCCLVDASAATESKALSEGDNTKDGGRLLAETDNLSLLPTAVKRAARVSWRARRSLLCCRSD